MPDTSIFSSNLPATIALFAAGVTAFFGSLKFFSDKAAKVTDFRKAWIETLRHAVAEFSGHTHTIAGRIAIRKRHGGSRSSRSSGEAKYDLLGTEEVAKPQFDKEFETELLDHWSGLRLSYNKLILHMNPAEHCAYTLAEEAIAIHAAGPEKQEIRDQVVAFLVFCIGHAEATSRRLLEARGHAFPSLNEAAKQVILPDEKAGHEASTTEQGVGTQAPAKSEGEPTALDKAQEEIAKQCADAASSLLLSAFATRQLLHGDYDQVYGNMAHIERGIRAVDTSAGLVIKGAWEEIKSGEPTYARISWAGICISVILMVFLIIALFSGKPENKPRRFTASCLSLLGHDVVCEATILP